MCFNHIKQIKRALGIESVSTEQSAWGQTDDEQGSQTDMIISRKDNVVNMCEIKFYSDIFTVDKSYDMLLKRRQTLLKEYIPKKSIIHNTLITTYGIKDNEYRWSFENVIDLDDLFR